MTKQLQRADLGWVFRLGDGTDAALEQAHQVHEAAHAHIGEAMRKLPSFASPMREGPHVYTVEHYELCGADIDDLAGEVVFPVWFTASGEFSQQARDELEALVTRAFGRAAAERGVSCRLLARDEFRQWLVSERRSTPVAAS
jgi:hypothetical protein